MKQPGLFDAFDDVWLLDGVRTPMVDYCGALGHVSPTDLGIKAARAALARAGVPGEHIGAVLAGNMAPGDIDQFFLPRHIGLYAGMASRARRSTPSPARLSPGRWRRRRAVSSPARSCRW